MMDAASSFSRSEVNHARKLALGHMRDRARLARGDWLAAAEDTWSACSRNRRLLNALALIAAFSDRLPPSVVVTNGAFSPDVIATAEAVVATAGAHAKGLSPASASTWRKAVWEKSKTDEPLRLALARLFIFDICGGASFDP